MNLPKYPLVSSDKMMTFEFVSEGKNGIIYKIVKLDKSLSKLDDEILFPKKLEKANRMLKEIGLPKQWTRIANKNA